MKKILISIQPQWVEKILNGEKTVEIRKTMPKCELPAKVYIYCTHSKAKLYKNSSLLKEYKFEKKYNCWHTVIGIQTNTKNIIDSKLLNGKVVAEFTLSNIDDFSVFENGSVQYWSAHNLEKSALTYEEVSKYVGLNKKGYAWHISDLKIYDKPRKLDDFGLKRAPQSWQYVNHVEKESNYEN